MLDLFEAFVAGPCADLMGGGPCFGKPDSPAHSETVRCSVFKPSFTRRGGKPLAYGFLGASSPVGGREPCHVSTGARIESCDETREVRGKCEGRGQASQGYRDVPARLALGVFQPSIVGHHVSVVR